MFYSHVFLGERERRRGKRWPLWSAKPEGASSFHGHENIEGWWKEGTEQKREAAFPSWKLEGRRRRNRCACSTGLASSRALFSSVQWYDLKPRNGDERGRGERAIKDIGGGGLTTEWWLKLIPLPCPHTLVLQGWFSALYFRPWCDPSSTCE